MSLERENVASQFDFRLGPNYVDPPWLLRDGECASTVNLWWDDDGLRVVPPAALAVSTPWAAGTAIGLVVDWRDPTLYPFVATTEGYIRRWDGSAWTIEQSGLSTTARMRAEKMSPHLLFANGVDFVRVWDGATWTTLDQAPRFAYLAVAVGNDYMFGAGHHPTQIHYSELADPTVWPAGNTLDVALDERYGPVTGLARWGENVYAFTPSSIWIISGSDPSSFGVERTLSDLGTIHPDSIVATDVGLVFWAPTGPAIFNGVRSFTLSRRVRPLVEQLGLSPVIGGYDPGKRMVIFLTAHPREPSGLPSLGFLVDLRELAGTRAVNLDETLGAPCWPIVTTWDGSFGVTAFNLGRRSAWDGRPALWLATSTRRLLHWRLGFSNEFGATRLVSSAGWPEDFATFVGLAGVRTAAFMPKDPTRVMRIRHVDVWTRPTVRTDFCPAPVLRVGLRRMGELRGEKSAKFTKIGEVSNIATQEGPAFERFTGDGSGAYDFARWVQVEVTHDAGATPGADAPANATIHGVAVGWEPTSRRGAEPRSPCQAAQGCPEIGSVVVTSSAKPNRLHQWFFPIYIPRSASVGAGRLYAPVEGSQRLAWCDPATAQTWTAGTLDLVDLAVYSALDQTTYMGIFVPPNMIHLFGGLRRLSDGLRNGFHRIVTLTASDYTLGPLNLLYSWEGPTNTYTHSVWGDRNPQTGRLVAVGTRINLTDSFPYWVTTSTDGGGTWSSPVLIPNAMPPGPFNAPDDARIIDLDGLLVVVAPTHGTLGGECYIHYSADGATWTKMQLYNAGQFSQRPPSWNIVRDALGRVWWQFYLWDPSVNDYQLVVRQLVRSGNTLAVGPEEKSGIYRGSTINSNGVGLMGTAVADGRLVFLHVREVNNSLRVRATRFPDGHWTSENWTPVYVTYYLLGCRETDDVCGRAYGIAGEGPGAGVQRSVVEWQGSLS